MAAEEALIAQILLITGEGAFDTACGEFIQWSFHDVAEPPLGLDKKFAAKGIAGVFDNNEAGALLTIGANGMFAHYVISYQRVKLADIHFFRAVLVPEVE